MSGIVTISIPLIDYLLSEMNSLLRLVLNPSILVSIPMDEMIVKISEVLGM